MHARTANPLGLKILPLTDCSPRINSQNPAKPLIPIDQGEGGGVVKSNRKSLRLIRQGFAVELEIRN